MLILPLTSMVTPGSICLSLEHHDMTVYPSVMVYLISDVADKLVSHPIKKCFSYRRVNGIPLTAFISQIKLSFLISHSKFPCSELYQQYHTVLDKYAPIESKRITPKPQIHG